MNIHDELMKVAQDIRNECSIRLRHGFTEEAAELDIYVGKIESIAKAAQGEADLRGWHVWHKDDINRALLQTDVCVEPVANQAVSKWDAELVAWRVDWIDASRVSHTWYYYPPNGADAVDRHRKAGHAITPRYASPTSISPVAQVEAEKIGEGSDTGWCSATLYRDIPPGTPVYLAPPADSAQALVDAADKVLVGGNHLASLLIGRMGGGEWPEDGASVREKYGVETYDAWCCWKAIMEFRDAIESRSQHGQE